jgi:1-acyl-sn-glycerol-3-phosphate acyltransferase
MGTQSTDSTEKSLRGANARDYLSYFRSLVFTDPLIYLYTVVCGTFSLVGSLFDAGGRWQHGCARVWSWLILKTSRIRLRSEGLERVNPRASAIFCVNHQSSMDIPVLLVALPFQFRFVAKRSLFRLPFLGWHLRRSGHIPVDRRRPGEARKSMDEAARKIHDGYPVLMFPEGGRSRTPELLPFKSGAFLLAIRSGVPVIPVTLNGTRWVLTPDTYHVRSGEVEMIVHPPIPTEGLSLEDVRPLAERARNQILSRFKPASR